jgi:phosphoesterase RecJ-like protein
VLDLSDALLAQTGTNVYDTDGIINMPFMANEIEAVALIRTEGAHQVRVSLRSKGDVDVRAIAGMFGGGGHRNASGFTVNGDGAQVRERVIALLREALEANVAQP